ncbi:hypothetical protein BGZ54_002506 [Gamsiella multidivaricata]|nr:hypothetical protein BGZ54_002506 [Gamsiella multidivaricata]
MDWNVIAAAVEIIKTSAATFKLDDIYNADETGLFLQSTSSWTVDMDGGAAGTKIPSIRVSILFCTNATDSDKRKPFILSEKLPKGFRHDEELQGLVEVEPWKPQTNAQEQNVAEQEAAVIVVQDATDTTVQDVTERAVQDATDMVKGQQKGEQVARIPKAKPKKCADYMNPFFLGWLKNFQQSIVEKDPSRQILLLVDNASCHTKAARSSPDFPNIKIMATRRWTTSAKRTRILKAKLKESNKEGFHFIVHAWDAVKPQSIRGCFRHVPILCEAQQLELSPHEQRDTDVLEALAEEQHNILHQVRSQGYHESLSTSPQFSMDFMPPLSATATADTPAHNFSSQEQGLGIADALGYHGALMVSVSKLLDGSPFISKLIDEKQVDANFMSFFVPKKKPAEELLCDEWLESTSEGEDTEYEDFDTDYSEKRSKFMVTSERGSPLKPKVNQRYAHGRKYRSLVEQLASSGTSDPSGPESSVLEDGSTAEEGTSDGEEEDDGAGERETEGAIRGQIHSLLHAAALLMRGKKLNQHRRDVEKMADTVWNKSFDGIDVANRNN